MTALLIALLIGFLGSELYACFHVLAKWLVRHHASKLPPGFRERMEEEWLAALEEFPSHIWKLKFALELFVDRADLLQAHREKKTSDDVTVALTGVSATGSVGQVISVEPAVIHLTGHAPIVITAVGSLGDVTIQGGHIASTARLFPPSVSSSPRKSD